jgi:hypothetical protein
MADAGGFGAFREEIKTYLALKEIQDDIKSEEQSILSDKSKEITQRMKRIKDDISFNIRRMYNILIIGDEKILLGQPTVGKESLSNWYKMELISREKLASNLHYRFLVNKFIEGKDQIETKVILDQFYKDPAYVIPESPEVIRRSIQQGIAEGAFALGYKTKGEIDKETVKFQTNIPTNTISLDEGETLLSKTIAADLIKGIKTTVDKSEKTIKEEKAEYETKEKDKNGGPIRYKKISLRIENIPSSKIADLSRGVLMPLSKEIGGFNFNMEIDITNPEGVSELTLKNKVKETISQIGAKITKEEKK